MCLIVAFKVKLLLLSWHDLLLLCANHTHIHTPWLLANRQELEARFLQLYCYCAAPVNHFFDSTPATHTYLLHKEAHKRTHRRTRLWLVVIKGHPETSSCISSVVGYGSCGWYNGFGIQGIFSIHSRGLRFMELWWGVKRNCCC